MSFGCERLFLRCLKPLDERVSIKLLLRVWGPRFEFIVRLVLVATFLEDSFRAATHFSEHTEQIGAQGYLKPLVSSVRSAELVGNVARVVLGIGLLAQLLGSLCLLALLQPDRATKALIGWVIAQPVLYAQLANAEFVAESISLVGGLLILRAHLSEQARREGDEAARVALGGGGLCAPDKGACAAIARTQLLGRLLLPAYLYHAGIILLGGLAADLRHSFSTFVVDAAVLVSLVFGCVLLAVGLRSRTVALSLALANLGFICLQHPFFRYAWREGGEWKCRRRPL
jgi:uncharacterized membrane protein YphA (DoxX/SURF4 family)